MNSLKYSVLNEACPQRCCFTRAWLTIAGEGFYQRQTHVGEGNCQLKSPVAFLPDLTGGWGRKRRNTCEVHKLFVLLTASMWCVLQTTSPALWHHLGGLWFSSVPPLTSANIRLQSLRGSVPQTAHTSDASCKWRLRPHAFLYGQLQISRFPGHPLVFFTLLKQWSELTKEQFTYYYQFIVKYKSGTARREGCSGKNGGGGSGSFYALSRCDSLPAHCCVHWLRRLSILRSRSLDGVSSPRRGWLNHWPLVNNSSLALSPPQRQGLGWNF